MIGRLCFGSVLVTAAIVAACGRQVTPNPPGIGAGGAPLGYMAVYFDVSSPFNFSNYQYMFVFNTTGSNVTPSTQTLQTNWAGYSYALIALGTGGTTYAKPVQFVRNANPHISPAWLPLGTTPAQFSFNPNSNGSGTEFSMLFQQSIFKGIASPGPSSSPRGFADTWTFNAFVTQASSQGQWLFYDSMGVGGPVPPEYPSPALCITEPFDDTIYANTDQQIQDPSAEITSVQIANNPVHPSPCP